MKTYNLKFQLSRFFLLPLIALSFVSNSCSKSDEIKPDVDYTIFGHFFGECFGEECVEIFMIQAENLYEDTHDYYPFANQSYDGEYIQLDKDKYLKVKDVPILIPKEIYDELNVVGQPDAGDWGGIFLETRINGEVRFWKIDMMKENLPEYLHEFVDTIVYCINEIQ